MPLTDQDVREILRIVDESDLSELRIDTDGFSLYVRKGGPGAPAADSAPTAPEPAAATIRERTRDQEPSEPAAASQDRLLTIPAPMLGTFYRSEGPGQPPFVEPGSRVEPDTIVCIIEVMKMMNSVPAGVSGRILQIFPANAELVEYGQPLFEVEPT